MMYLESIEFIHSLISRNDRVYRFVLTNDKATEIFEWLKPYHTFTENRQSINRNGVRATLEYFQFSPQFYIADPTAIALFRLTFGGDPITLCYVGSQADGTTRWNYYAGF